MEYLLLAVFSTSIIISVIRGISLIYPLVFAYLLFFIYGLVKGFKTRELLGYSLEGLKRVRTILSVFILIGMMTALWRASGTIAYLVHWGTLKISPRVMPLMAFILASGLSLVTGTSFGSAASLGTVVMGMARAMDISQALIGGALLSGVYLGDRSSPVSTSALLVSEVTKTDLYKNIRTMFKTALVPLILSLLIYLVLGLGIKSQAREATSLLAKNFNLSFWSLLPVFTMLLASLMGLGARKTILINILAGALVALSLQKMELGQVITIALGGYKPEDPLLRQLLGGGGILSMGQAFFVVGLSSSYMGILEKTGFLKDIKAFLRRIPGPSFNSVLLSSLVAAMLACNQSLAILLGWELNKEIEEDPYKLASHLENSAVVLPPLIPWSIASSLPLAAMGATSSSIPFAFYLILLPLVTLVLEAKKFRSNNA